MKESYDFSEKEEEGDQIRDRLSINEMINQSVNEINFPLEYFFKLYISIYFNSIVIGKHPYSTFIFLYFGSYIIQRV